MRKRAALLIALPLIILSSAGIVTILSAQDSAPQNTAGSPSAAEKPTLRTDAAKEQGSGTPAEIRFHPDRVYRGSGSVIYGVSLEQGILFSPDNGLTWTARNSGLPQRAVYPFAGMKPPVITSFAIDPLDTAHVALTLADQVYVSGDSGLSWEKIPVIDPLAPNDQLTAIALNPLSRTSLLVGTSFHGFFETANNGKTWTELSKNLVFMYFGGGSYEEVCSLAYYPPDPSIVIFCLGFGKGLYWTEKGSKTAAPIYFPGSQENSPIVDLSLRRASDPTASWNLEVRTDLARWSYGPLSITPASRTRSQEKAAAAAGLNPEWKLLDLISAKTPGDTAREARRTSAEGKFGIYVSSYRASGKYLDEHIAFLKTHGLNSMVVDFKDDYGYVAYDSRLSEPKRIGAVQKRFSVEELVQKAHQNGIYVIARLPVFRDKALYNSDGFAYAAWDKIGKQPWRYLKKTLDPETGEESFVQGEYWVDPYCPKVWQYNTDIAKELQDRGVDEIQFDYIRFPSDGDLSRISYRFQKAGMGKIEALESFLAKARESLSVPISADVYGYCGWARVSNWVAQNIEMYSRYVDVISPMFYPSHFPGDFLSSMPYMSRANYIYREGSSRAARIVSGRSIIRPYIQAFLLGGELKFNNQQIKEYLDGQVNGALEGESSGFIFWNASNNYYMVTEPLRLLSRSSHPEAAQGGRM